MYKRRRRKTGRNKRKKIEHEPEAQVELEANNSANEQSEDFDFDQLISVVEVERIEEESSIGYGELNVADPDIDGIDPIPGDLFDENITTETSDVCNLEAELQIISGNTGEENPTKKSAPEAGTSNDHIRVPRGPSEETIIDNYSRPPDKEIDVTPPPSNDNQNSQPPSTEGGPDKRRQLYKAAGIIEVLLVHNFTSGIWTDAHREKIIAQGQPKITVQNDPNWTEINLALLKHNKKSPGEWLTVSYNLKMFLCWPCLLFAKHRGFAGKFPLLSYFTERTEANTLLRDHDKSYEHMLALDRLSVWQYKVRDKIPTQTLHDNVRQNLNFFSYLIDAICFHRRKCSFEEVTETLRLVASKHANMSKCSLYNNIHSAQFSELIEHYYELMLTSVIMLMKSRMADEIRKAKFVFLTIENSPDASSSHCLSVILRYDLGLTVYERFVQFITADGERSTDKILEQLLAIAKYFNCLKTLIGITYDCSVNTQIFNMNVERFLPSAHFVHHYKHSLKSLIYQSICQLNNIHDFVIGLTGLIDLFKKREDLRNLLNQYIFTSWDSSQDFVIILANKFRQFLLLFRRIQLDPNRWSIETLFEANFFIHFMTTFRNSFLILLLGKILSLTETLDLLVGSSYDFEEFSAEHLKILNELRILQETKYADILLEAESLTVGMDWINSGEKIDPFSLSKEIRDIHRLLIRQAKLTINERVSGFRRLSYFNVSSQFVRSGILLQFSKPLSLHDPNFNLDKLLAELEILHQQPAYKDGGFKNLVNVEKKWGIGEFFPHFLQYAALMQTIPAKSTDPITVSASSRISRYFKENRGSTSTKEAFFAAEEEMLVEMQKQPSFHDQVFKNFFS